MTISSTTEEISPVGLPTVIFTGCVTAVLLSALFVVQRESKKRKASAQPTALPVPIKESRNLIDKTKFPGGQITIYYATQTGTAESFAQQLEREGADHGFHIRVVDLEDVKVEDFLKATPFGEDDVDETKQARAILLAATYGEGEPTDNSNEMVQLLKERLEDPQPIFNGLEFAVFGLGNRQYEHYNAMGKFFDEALVKLGAERVIPLGLGDDDADLEADFESWKESMWVALKKRYCNEAVITKSSTTQLPACEYTIQYHSQPAKPNLTVPLDQVHGSGRVYFTAVDCPVVINKELRSREDGGSTKHIEIDISQAPPGFHYTTADNLGVLPLNDTKTVESVAAALGYDLDAVFSLQASPGHEWHGDPFPMPLTVRECLTRYLDLTSAPRRSDLKLLTQYATDKVDRQALLRLSSKEGKLEYKEKIMQSYVGMADLLRLCPSLTIPLEHFISLCHFLLPRYYTIASSSLVHPQTIHLTVAVTQEKRKDGTLFEGVCSTHLALRQPLDTVRVMVRPSTFRLPSDSSRPIIMIGPGTGIAPMRAFLQERFHQKTSQNKIRVGSNILYFGCKRRDWDFLYQEELESWQEQGLELHIAFSRESTTNTKVYVQHLLQKNGKETWDCISSQQASIYVCGGVKMGHDVTETLKEILVQHGEMSFDKAKDYLAKLASEGRFVQELWA